MEYQEYMEIEVLLNGPFVLPNEFFDDSGELDLETGMQSLVDKGLIYNNSTSLPQYGEELKEAHPGAYRFLDCFYDSQKRALSDKMIEQGYLNYYIEDGNEIVRWTEKGAAYLEEQRRKIEGDQ